MDFTIDYRLRFLSGQLMSEAYFFKMDSRDIPVKNIENFVKSFERGTGNHTIFYSQELHESFIKRDIIGVFDDSLVRGPLYPNFKYEFAKKLETAKDNAKRDIEQRDKKGK